MALWVASFVRQSYTSFFQASDRQRPSMSATTKRKQADAAEESSDDQDAQLDKIALDYVHLITRLTLRAKTFEPSQKKEWIDTLRALHEDMQSSYDCDDDDQEGDGDQQQTKKIKKWSPQACTPCEAFFAPWNNKEHIHKSATRHHQKIMSIRIVTPLICMLCIEKLDAKYDEDEGEMENCPGCKYNISYGPFGHQLWD